MIFVTALEKIVPDFCPTLIYKVKVEKIISNFPGHSKKDPKLFSKVKKEFEMLKNKLFKLASLMNITINFHYVQMKRKCHNVVARMALHFCKCVNPQKDNFFI